MHKLLVVFALIGTAHAGPIKVLGLNGNSKIIVGEMSPEIYSETLVMTKEALDQQVVHGLANYQDKAGWQLAKFSLGIAAKGTIGIGPFQFGKTLKQRFIYSR